MKVPAPTDTVVIARASAVQAGSPVAAHIGGVELVLLEWGRRIHVFQGTCPHEGTLLATGCIVEGQLVCPMHGWRFDCTTGDKIGNTRVPLRSFSAWVERDEVRVSRKEILDWAATNRTADRRPQRLRQLHDLPGPKRLPIAGNLLQLDLKRLHLILDSWCDQHGPLYLLHLGRKPMVAVGEPELIHSILRSRPDSYRRLTVIDTVLGEMGIKGVLSAENDEWRRQRRVVAQALNAEHLRSFFATLATVTERLRRRFQRAAEIGAAVEVQKDMMRFTVDVTCGLAFGYDMNTIEGDGDMIQRYLEQICPMVSYRINALVPYWRYLRLPADRRLDRALKAVRKTTSEFIERARAKLTKDASQAGGPRNFLEAMLADAVENGFTDEDVFGNVITMLLAGEDTTANTMAWMLHFLVDRPDVVERIREGLDQVLTRAEPTRLYESVQKLTFVEAVANAVLLLPCWHSDRWRLT